MERAVADRHLPAVLDGEDSGHATEIPGSAHWNGKLHCRVLNVTPRADRRTDIGRSSISDED
jgi:hypothetical protein